MNIHRAVTSAAASLLVLAGATGVAMAAGGSAAQPTSPQGASVSTEAGDNGPDTDNLQQGDQTAPDVGGRSSAVGGRSDRVSKAEKGAADTAGKTDAETDGESSGEAVESDGPGGHADPSGNVDHQFEGVE